MNSKASEGVNLSNEEVNRLLGKYEKCEQIMARIDRKIKGGAK